MHIPKYPALVLLLLLLPALVPALPSAASISYSFTIVEDRVVVLQEMQIISQEPAIIEIAMPADSRAIDVKLNNAPMPSPAITKAAAKKTLSISIPQGTSEISISLITSEPLERASKSFFLWDLRPGVPSGSLDVSVALPDRAVLDQPVSEGSGSIYPKPGSIETDGRRLLFRWNYANTGAGSIATIFIIYSQPSGIESLLLPAAIVVVAAAFALYFFLRIRARTKAPAAGGRQKKPAGQAHPTETPGKAPAHAKTKAPAKAKATVPQKQKHEQPPPESHLLKDELAVVEMLRSAPGKTMKQKEILRRTEFSKAKLTRLLRNLEERRLVEKTPEGKTNIIRLVE